MRPDAALKGWAERLPAAAGKGGTKDGLADELDQALLPLLDGARGALTRAAGRQRAEEDTAAGVAWVNEASRLAAQAPAELARETGQRIARILGPELGKLFLDKVAAWQARRALEQDAERDLAADPRLAGGAPEVLADLERDRLRLAREQGLSREVEAARQRSALSRALAEEATAVTRGEAGPPRSREDFLALYDAREGETRWQLWQAHQAKVPAYALVRGRGPEEIAAAKAGYQGDAAILERVEREDAAERARDPAGYALTWAKGYRRAYEEAQDPAEKAAILWAAQAAAGIPEEGRSPWTAEQGWALSERWFAIDAGAPHQVARTRVALLREVLLDLPPEQRAAGVAQLARLGLDAEAPGRIAAIAAAVEQNQPGVAYVAAGPDYRPATPPELVQIADSGQIKSDADSALLQLAQAVPFASPEILGFGAAAPTDRGDELARAIQGLPPASDHDGRIESWTLRKNEPIAIVPPEQLHADAELRSATDLLARSGMTAPQADAVVGELAALRGAGAPLDLAQMAEAYATLLPAGSGDTPRQEESAAQLSQAFQQLQAAGGHMTLAELALLERSPAYAERSGRGTAWIDDEHEVLGTITESEDGRTRIVETSDGLLFAFQDSSGRWLVGEAISAQEVGRLARNEGEDADRDHASEVGASGSPGEDPNDDRRKTAVYRALNRTTGAALYIGITKAFTKRASYWLRTRAYKIKKLEKLENLSRLDALAVETALIRRYGIASRRDLYPNGVLDNRIHPIARDSSLHEQMVAHGEAILKAAGY